MNYSFIVLTSTQPISNYLLIQWRTMRDPPYDNDNRAMCMEVWFRGMFGGVSPNCFSIRQRQIMCEWLMVMGGSRVVLLCHVKPKLINLKWRYFFNWKMQPTSHSRLNWICISNMRSIHLTLKSILRPHSPSSKTTRPEHWRSFTIHSMWQLAIVTMVLCYGLLYDDKYPENGKLVSPLINLVWHKNRFQRFRSIAVAVKCWWVFPMGMARALLQWQRVVTC